jgi:serine/threonine protein kinase
MEKHVLNRLNQANVRGVVRLYETFKDDFTLYFLMQYVSNGEIWHLSKVWGLPEAKTRYYFARVVDIVAKMHEQGIIHRDIKSENIMLTPDHEVVFVDFGTAKDVENPQILESANKVGKREFKNFVGTPHFMPPE